MGNSGVRLLVQADLRKLVKITLCKVLFMQLVVKFIMRGSRAWWNQNGLDYRLWILVILWLWRWELDWACRILNFGSFAPVAGAIINFIQREPAGHGFGDNGERQSENKSSRGKKIQIKWTYGLSLLTIFLISINYYRRGLTLSSKTS